MVSPELVLCRICVYALIKRWKTPQHFCFTCSSWTKLINWILLKLGLFCRQQSSVRQLVCDTTPCLSKGKKPPKKLQASVNDLTSSHALDETKPLQTSVWILHLSSENESLNITWSPSFARKVITGVCHDKREAGLLESAFVSSADCALIHIWACLHVDLSPRW